MHLIDSLAVGGAERMLVDMVNALNPLEFAVSVCVTRKTSTLASQIRKGIPFEVLNRQYTFDPAGFYRLHKYAEEQGVEIFHAHGRSTFAFLCVAHFLGVIKKPIILHDHYGDIVNDKSIPYWFPWVKKRYLAHYIGVSDLLGKWAVYAGVPKKRVSVVENGLDLNRFCQNTKEDIRAKLLISHDQKICIMVGNLRPAKGLDLLIQSCSGIPIGLLPAFVIVGKDADPVYTRMCKELVKKAKLEAFFHFVGPQEDSIAWIKGADLAVMPSRSESGPLVLIEYLACGLPFIAFNVGGISQQVSEKLPEFFAPPEDVEGFQEKLIALLRTIRDKPYDHFDKLKSIALQMFDIRTRLPAIEDIYQTLLEITT